LGWRDPVNVSFLTFGREDERDQKDFFMNIYVGNLNYSSTNDGLREHFEQFGEVSSAKIIEDRETGRSRGFGFVEMPNDDEGKAAVEGLDGKELDNRALRVNEARPRENRPQRKERW
jgi:cold-inducible RNA-binding protein